MAARKKVQPVQPHRTVTVRWTPPPGVDIRYMPVFEDGRPVPKLAYVDFTTDVPAGIKNLDELKTEAMFRIDSEYLHNDAFTVTVSA